MEELKNGKQLNLKRFRGMYQQSRKGLKCEDVDKFKLDFCFCQSE